MKFFIAERSEHRQRLVDSRADSVDLNPGARVVVLPRLALHEAKENRKKCFNVAIWWLEGLQQRNNVKIISIIRGARESISWLIR